MTEIDFRMWQRAKRLGIEPPPEYYRWLDYYAAREYGVKTAEFRMNDSGVEER